MKLRTGLLALLSLALIGYGGAKAYLYFKVKSKIDELIGIAAPFAAITYDGISSDLRGKLGIGNIVVKSATGAQLQIDSIELEGPGPGFLWDLTGAFKYGDPPASLILKLNRLALPADQALGGALGGVAFSEPGDDTQSGPQPCTLDGLLSHTGVERIGMSTLVANLSMGYAFNRASGEAELFLENELLEMDELSLSMSLRGVNESAGLNLNEMPAIAAVDLRYSIYSPYIKRMVAECARQVQRSPEQFVDSIFNQPSHQLGQALGLIPGPGIKQVLRELVSQGGEVRLKAHPDSILDPAALSSLRPEVLTRLLNIELYLNDQPVEDLTFALAEQAAAAGSGSESQEGGKAEPESDSVVGDGDFDAAGRGQRDARRLRYMETEIAELQHYLGSRVRLYTDQSSKPKTGYLIAYNGRTFSVEQSVHGGTMTAHIQQSELTRAEVLRRVP